MRIFEISRYMISCTLDQLVVSEQNKLSWHDLRKSRSVHKSADYGDNADSHRIKKSDNAQIKFHRKKLCLEHITSKGNTQEQIVAEIISSHQIGSILKIRAS